MRHQCGSCVVFDYTHEDLAGNIWYDSEGHCGYNFYSDSYHITPDAHAMHVAGTIAAVNNNGTGVAALVVSTCGGPGFTSADLLRRLRTSTCRTHNLFMRVLFIL